MEPTIHPDQNQEQERLTMILSLLQSRLDAAPVQKPSVEREARLGETPQPQEPQGAQACAVKDRPQGVFPVCEATINKASMFLKTATLSTTMGALKTPRGS